MTEEVPLSQTLCEMVRQARRGGLPSVERLLERHCFEELCALARVTVLLARLEERSVSPNHLTLLLRAVVLALGGDSEACLLERSPVGEAEAEEDWFLSEEQRAVRYPPHRRRLTLMYLILRRELQDEELASQCLALLPLPGTELGRLGQWLSLSPYMLKVVWDFHLAERVDHRLLYIVCTNRQVAVVNVALAPARCTESEFLRRQLREKTKELMRQRRRGVLSRGEMDALMVHHFLGWARTVGGHTVFVYYRGPSSRTEQDMSRAENWRLLKADFLRFFHTRVGKDLSPYMLLNSSDVTVDAHRNPLLDVRLLAQRWARKNPERLRLIGEHGDLLS